MRTTRLYSTDAACTHSVYRSLFCLSEIHWEWSVGTIIHTSSDQSQAIINQLISADIATDDHPRRTVERASVKYARTWPIYFSCQILVEVFIHLTASSRKKRINTMAVSVHRDRQVTDNVDCIWLTNEKMPWQQNYRETLNVDYGCCSWEWERQRNRKTESRLGP